MSRFLFICLITILIQMFGAAGFNRSKINQFSKLGVGHNRVQKIAGGIPVSLGELPYQAQILRIGQHFCGGAIISQGFVITAGQCAFEGSPSEYQVRVGHTSDTNPEPSAQTRDVTQVITPDDFVLNTFRNDVAVLRLSAPLEFNEFISAIAIPSQGCTVGTSVNEQLLFSGWGKAKNDGPNSPVLLKVAMPVVSQTKCNSAWGRNAPKEICAGTNGKGACLNDQGGPLATTRTPRTLIGTLSITPCNTTQNPDVFQRIHTFSNWIKEKAEMQ